MTRSIHRAGRRSSGAVARAAAATATAALLIALAGCVQMPTETRTVADLRPQISFSFSPDDRRLGDARVLIDGLDMGPVHQFTEGVAALRILPGTHRLHIVQGGQVLMNTRFYVADGVNRTFQLK